MSDAPLRVIHLEDDELDAELVAARLGQSGLEPEIVRARDEASFRAALDGGDIRAVLSDFSLPGWDGLRALELAKRRLPDVPFLFVSGAIGEERAIETLRRGATDYVLKDRLERLGPALHRAIVEAEDRRLRREAEAERDRLLVSEREAREAAEAANRMKDEFLAVVSHELRTPLNAIVGWASLIGDGTKVDADMLRKGLETIGRNARVQVRLIEDILDISRIVTGKLHLRPAPTRIEPIVRAASDAIRPAAEAKEIQVTVEVAPDAGELVVDADRLQQVVWNLLSNAVKFMPGKGGLVAVRVTRDEDVVTVEVSDSGAGIPPELLPYVFERFRQGDGSVTRAHGGLGLGLAIVRHLVEMHGGRVRAESPGRGHGSTFRIELPVRGASGSVAPGPSSSSEVPAASSTPPPSIVTPPSTREEVLRGVRVLVVDDEVDARELAVEILAGAGATVAEAASVEEAVAAIYGGTLPDVVVSDIGMPLVNGYSLVRRLRASSNPAVARLPAIALTAYTREMDRREAHAAGYQRHLAKPVSPRELVTAVVDVLAPHDAEEPPRRAVG